MKRHHIFKCVQGRGALIGPILFGLTVQTKGFIHFAWIDWATLTLPLSCVFAGPFIEMSLPVPCRLSLVSGGTNSSPSASGAHTRPGWCLDDERQRIPPLPASRWLWVGGSRRKAIYHLPLPPGPVTGGTGRHMCAWITSNPPTDGDPPPSPPPASPSFPSEAVWHTGGRTWGIRSLRSIKAHIYSVHQDSCSKGEM